MDDVPSSSFQDFDLMMEKLGLGSPSTDHVDNGGQEIEKGESEESPITWRERDSERLRDSLKISDTPTRGTKQQSEETWRENKQVTPEVGKTINYI